MNGSDARARSEFGCFAPPPVASTLVELLVVIAVIGTLAARLLARTWAKAKD